MQTSIYRMDTQQGPKYSTWNYITYPVINHKEYEKEYMYICNIYMSVYV